jgi:putative FmdB family regulatory protein
MPFYEYECSHCGHRFEVMLSMSGRDEEEKRLACPECATPRPRRMISNFCSGVSGGFSGRGSGSPPPCSSGGG